MLLRTTNFLLKKLKYMFMVNWTTIVTLSIGTPYLLTILVLKLKIVHFTTY